MSSNPKQQTINSVFVVDNDPAVCSFMTMFLQKEGFTIKTAEDGLAALSVLEDYEPDVIFIDLVMPNIGGEKLCQILRSQRRYDDTYLIVLSAISSEEEVDYEAIGFDVCIAKGPLKKVGEIILDVVGQLGTTITRAKPGGTFGLENLYRREITRELLSTKRHFELILGNMAEGIIETTSGGKIVFANTAVVELLKVTEEILLSSDFALLFEEGQKNQVQLLLTSALDNPKENPGSIQLIYQSSVITMQVLPVIDEGDTTLVVIINDITEKQKAQKALQKAHDELESRVEARTAELASTNESLQVEITRRQILEKKMLASLKEKEILLDEIHHRVKNNLQIISSLLGLNSRRLKSEELRGTIQDMRNRIQSLSLVHDKLYRSGNLAAVDIGDYLTSLINQLVSSYTPDPNRIKVRVDVDRVFFGLDHAVPCALIVTELITNSLKYAFPDAASGEIRAIIQKSSGNDYLMEIGDNGKGLPHEIDLNNPINLGLRIVKVLARQLDARMQIGRNEGTTYRFVFPAGEEGEVE